MELRELRNFMRVARAGSVSRAAQELRLAQPALSRQIRKLEHELGVSLFTRHGRGVRLSTAGSLLLERAEAITHLVHQAGEDIKDDRVPSRGRLTLGVPPAAGRLLVPSFAERFHTAWPSTTLHLREGVTSSLQEWLLEKRIDIAILHNPPSHEALDIGPILRERMLVVTPASARIKSRKHPVTFRISELGDLPLILPNMAHNNRRLVEHAAHEHGVRLRIKIEADSVAFAKALVEKGLGYTILTYAAVQDEVARNTLAVYPIVRPTLSTQVTIVTLRDKQLSRLLHETRDLLHDVCRTLVHNKTWTGAQLD
ncbi:MAG: LysR family transcriptional regulator [Pseudolabrys sp.]|nr:LysR family transcriptional regulator [Pseudolabrys sp.]